MGTMASQITSLTSVYPAAYSSADQRKHQCSASLAFVWGIHRWPVNSPHKWPATRKMFPFDDVIMNFADALVALLPATRCNREIYINILLCVASWKLNIEALSFPLQPHFLYQCCIMKAVCVVRISKNKQRIPLFHDLTLNNG